MDRRLTRLTNALQVERQEPGMVILLEDAQGILWLNGAPVDYSHFPDGTQFVVLKQRLDGPQ